MNEEKRLRDNIGANCNDDNWHEGIVKLVG